MFFGGRRLLYFQRKNTHRSPQKSTKKTTTQEGWREKEKMKFFLFLSSRSWVFFGKKSFAMFFNKLSIIVFSALVFSGTFLAAQNLPTTTVEAPNGTEVNVKSGNLFYERLDLFLPSQGLDIEARFAYSRSRDTVNVGYGFGWLFNYGLQYALDSGNVVILRTVERMDTFQLVMGAFEAPPGVYDELVEYQPAQYRLTDKSGIKYYFDDAAHQKLTSVEDRNGNTLTLNYVDGLLQNIVHSAGEQLDLTWTDGLLTQITNNNITPARTVTFTYENNNLMSATGPLGYMESYTYDDLHRMTTLTDRNNAPVTMVYSSVGSVLKIISCENELTFTYSGETNQTVVAEKSGGTDRVSAYIYDAEGNLVEFENADGGSFFMVYDDDRNPIQITDFNGHARAFTYDGKGNILTKTDPLGNTTSYTYEPNFNQRASITQPNGATVTFGFDAKGNITSITLPEGVSETYTYDAFGNMTSSLDGEGHLTTSYFRANGLLDSLGFPIGNPRIFEYNDARNLTKVIEPNGNETMLEYNSRNELTKIVYPLNNTLEYTYDGNGNLLSVTDGNNNTRSFTYDALNRLGTVTIPAGTTLYEYDNLGNLERITDANGNKTTYVHDILGRLLSMTDAAGNTTVLEYDSNGNVTRQTNPNGTTVNVAYDALNRTISKSYAEDTDTYSYDANGNLANVVNSHANISFAYDNLNRMTAKTYNTLGKSIQYTYDGNNNRASMTDPDGGTTTYTYDAKNRLANLTNGGGQTYTFTRDDGNRLTRLDNPNGTYTTYTFNLADRLTGVHNFDSGGSLLSFYTYTYDNFGNRLTMTEGTGTHTYNYDDSYRITNVTYGDGDLESFTYDGAGNRTNRTYNGNPTAYTYNEADQLQTADGASYTFNDNGNLTGKTLGGMTTNYNYDAQNRLTQVTLPTGKTNHFQYDPLGNRISRTDSSGVTNRFLFDERNMLFELNYDNTTRTKFTSNLEINNWLGMEQSGNNYVYHQDGLQSITGISNDAETLVNTYEYDVYGNLNAQTGSLDNMLTYTGQPLDDETELYFYRSRYYDASVGRFTTKDRFEGLLDKPLTLHKYGYANGNPVNYVDPEGDIAILTAIAIVGAGVALYQLYDAGKNLANSAERTESLNKQYWQAINSGDLNRAQELYSRRNNSAVQTAAYGAFLVAETPGTSASLGRPPSSRADLATDLATDIAKNILIEDLPPCCNQGGSSSNNGVGGSSGGPTSNGSVGSDGSGQNINIDRVHAIDPNEISGVLGYDSAQWVSIQDELGYTVFFENDPEFATAPAQLVQIDLPLDTNFDIFSVRIASFGFGFFSFEVPPNTTYYQERLDVRDSLNVFVDVTAGVDVVENKVFWIFESIDPLTGLPPEDALTGFLPVNDTSITIYNDTLPKRGEGYVTFSIKPDESNVTGDSIMAQADIIFDLNAPLSTNVWKNFLDALPPTSTLDSLPENTPGNTVTLNWTSEDDPSGVGIGFYDLYVSKNGEAFNLAEGGIDTSTTIFTGSEGSIYAFYTRATDYVGNVEPPKFVGEQETTFVDTIELIAPIAGSAFCERETLSTEWTSTGIDSVNILFSTDGGSNFTSLVNGLPTDMSPLPLDDPSNSRK